MEPRDVYWAFAIGGTVFFALRSLLLLAGFGHDDAGPVDPGDVYHDTNSASGVESSFRLFSMFSVSAFLMTFGWAGLSATEEFQLGWVGALFTALGAGGFAMLATAYLFALALKLTSDGSVFSLESTVGQNASVYERIPAEGFGRVQMNVSGMLREIQAVSEKKIPIESFQRVTVTRVIDSETVAVEPAQT